VPVLPANCSRSEFVRAFKRAQCVVLRHAAHTSVDATAAVLEALRGAHAAAPALLDGSFTLENGGTVVAPTDTSGVLAHSPTDAAGTWYASFILQGASRAAALAVHAQLPCAVPRPLAAEPGVTEPSQPTWFFIGANSAASPLAGRPEHTDSLSHDGTWHFQLSGRKVWRIRPTDELLVESSAALGPTQVECRAGDVLVINTRLWWHSTELPAVPAGRTRGGAGGTDRLSISYARDFVLSDSTAAAALSRAAPGSGVDADTMTNVDGLFATRHVARGTVVLRAAQMPDCELPVSGEYNCVVREDADTGELVLVASRNIASGEFFSVAADSDAEDSDSDEGEDPSEQERSEEESEEGFCFPCR
jgi:hypothetical protein